jgi:cobalt-zinc-cadmium efflux system protein
MLVGEDSDCHKLRRRMERALHDRFEIEHGTLQVDHQSGELLGIEMREQGDAGDAAVR